jgi:hypothetical protein
MKRYHSSNFRIIPEGKGRYFGLETEKTATLGKNRYVVTDSTVLRTTLGESKVI